MRIHLQSKENRPNITRENIVFFIRKPNINLKNIQIYVKILLVLQNEL